MSLYLSPANETGVCGMAKAKRGKNSFIKNGHRHFRLKYYHERCSISPLVIAPAFLKDMLGV